MVLENKKYEFLVVEDNPGDYALIQDYLEEQFGFFNATHTKSYAETLDVLKKQHTAFDLILLDLSLPDKDGEGLIVELMLECGGCPIIVLTGYADISFSIRSLELGVSDYLVKDEITSGLLYKSIIYAIERKRISHELEASEKRYSTLFQMSPQPKFIVDPESLKIIHVNRSAIDKYGFTEKEFLEMTFNDIRPKEDLIKLNDSFERSIREDQNNNGIFRHEKKSGEIIYVEIFSNPISMGSKLYRSIFALDVTEKLRFENSITRAIIKTQEDERYEIGGELHDNVCQILATCQISLSMMKDSLAPAAIDLYKQTRSYITLALEEIRNLSHRLAPAFFNNTTLEESVGLLIKNADLENKYRIRLSFDHSMKEQKLDEELQLNLYRILQEQLRNILKYSKATDIDVDIYVHNGCVIMSITDNGIGFDKNIVRQGIGLTNIKRRAELFSGELEIVTSPGNGCEVTVKIPVEC
jgi:PAS domain S-box-containing protein